MHAQLSWFWNRLHEASLWAALNGRRRLEHDGATYVLRSEPGQPGGYLGEIDVPAGRLNLYRIRDREPQDMS